MATFVYSFDTSTNKPKVSTIDTTNLLLADGTVALTADWAAGAHQIQVSVDPSAANDLTRKSYVDAQISGVTVPTATAGSGGATEGTLTVDSDYGLTVTTGILRTSINTTRMQYTSNQLDVKETGIDHANLNNLNSTTYYHLTQAQHTDLTDSGDATLHFHSTDRDRANHTGTQTASTISDFTEVAQDAWGAAIAAGAQTAITVTYTDVTNKVDYTVNVDDVGIEVNGSNQLQLKDAGVTNAKLAGSIPFNKMATLTGDRAVITTGSGYITTSATTKTEIGYLSGVTSAIQTQLDAKLGLSGGTMTGNINLNGNKITGAAVPTLPTDYVTKAYHDANSAGLDFLKDVINIQTDAVLDPGASPTDGDRYIITASGTLHANFGTINKDLDGNALTLGDDDIVQYDSGNSEFRIAWDASVDGVGGGALTWNLNSLSFYNFDGTQWAEFGGLSGVTAGTGLTKSGSTISVNMGAGITELPTDEVGIDLATNGGLELTSLLTGGQLKAKVDDSTIGLSASGLYVKDLGITSTQLAATSVTAAKLGAVAGNGLTGGSGSALAVLGDTTGGANLATVVNVTANGVAVRIDNSTITENGSNQLQVAVGSLNHDSLGGLDTGDYHHLTGTQYTDLTDAGDSTLHYHATDRARANHTGTQLASTVSDFTEAAQDAAASMLTGGTHTAISTTYQDGSDALDLAVKYDNTTVKVNGSDQLTVDHAPKTSVTFTNNTGGTLVAGTIVSLSTTVAGEIVVADASDADAADAIGVVVADITNTNTGLVQVAGEATVVNDGTNLDLGKWVYVAPTANAGKATKTAPSGSDYQMKIGKATAVNKIVIEKQWIG